MSTTKRKATGTVKPSDGAKAKQQQLETFTDDATLHSLTTTWTQGTSLSSKAWLAIT